MCCTTAEAVIKMSSTTDARRPLIIKAELRIVNEYVDDPLTSGKHPIINDVTKEISDMVHQYFCQDYPYGVQVMPTHTSKTSEAANEVLMRIFYITFPNIIIDDTPVYNKLLSHIVKSLNGNSVLLESQFYGTRRWSEENLSLDDTIQNGGFDSMWSHKDLDMMSILNRDSMDLTQHKIDLDIDKFDYLLSYFRRFQAVKLFEENILYIASAFRQYDEEKKYGEQKPRTDNINQWIAVTRSFAVDDEIARKYYREGCDYAYTTVTMEEILRRHSEKLRLTIDNYEEKLTMAMIRKLFDLERLVYSRNLWKVFTYFIRRDHFYADKIYVLHGNVCRAVESTSLSPVIERFAIRVRDMEATLKREMKERDETADPLNITKRTAEIIAPFYGTNSDNFVLKACKSYLGTTIKSAIYQTATPFSDAVVVCQLNKLTTRQAFLEDQFISVSPMTIMDFNPHSKMGKQALEDIEVAFKRMYGLSQGPGLPDDMTNVQWMKWWFASLLAKRPERILLILYGERGENAKSSVFDAIRQIFDVFYYQALPTMLIAQKEGRTCTPMEAFLKNMAVAVFSEPSGTTPYSTETVKDITGEKVKTVAEKYKNPERIALTAKPAILTNSILTWDKPLDPAMRSRMRPVVCQGAFVLKPPTDPAEQERTKTWKADQHFWQKTIRVQAFLYMMINEWFTGYINESNMLQSTKAQTEELLRWCLAGSPFFRFTKDIQTVFEGNSYRTDASNVWERFKLEHAKNPKYSNISYTEFKEMFASETGWKVKPWQGQGEFYFFHHPSCNNRFLIQSVAAPVAALPQDHVEVGEEEDDDDESADEDEFDDDDEYEIDEDEVAQAFAANRRL